MKKGLGHSIILNEPDDGLGGAPGYRYPVRLKIVNADFRVGQQIGALLMAVNLAMAAGREAKRS